MSRTRWLVAALLAACLLGACNDDDPKPDIPDPTPSASTSPSASDSSPTSSPPAVLTPRETVDAWLEAWTVALKTGDVEQVTGLSSAKCKSCQRLISRVSHLYGNGGRLETDGWKATKIARAPDSVEETPSFVMQVRESRQVLFDETGAVVHETAETTLPMRMTFELAAQVWVLSRLEILE